MLLSRIAEHVYWTGRYLERAEATARIVAAHTEVYLDLPKAAGANWGSLLAVVGGLDEFAAAHPQTDEESIVHFLLCDADHAGSVVSSIARARQNLRTVRSLFPRGAWETVNELHLSALDDAHSAVARQGRLRWAESVMARIQRLTGLLNDTMAHDDAFSFLAIGRNVERADMTTRVLDVQASTLLGSGAGLRPYTDVMWMGVLNALGAAEAYRRRVHARVEGAGVVDFLLHDGQFPRSVECCITEISRHLLELPRYDGPMSRCATLQAQLEEGKRHPMGPAAGWALLRNDLDDVQVGLADLHGALGAAYFPGAPATTAALLSA